MSGKLSSKEIRKRIGHPVIDADGHWLEFGPSISDYLKEVAGADAVNSFRRRGGYVAKSLTMTPEERAQTRRAQEAFWGVPAKNTLDRATAMLPRLLYDRLDEFGFDFTVLYPTAGLAVGYIPEDEIRRASCRAFNMYIAHQFGEFSDRMTPAAAIPMHTPAGSDRRIGVRRQGTRPQGRRDDQHGAAARFPRSGSRSAEMRSFGDLARRVRHRQPV